MSLPPHDYAKKLIEVAESDLKAAEVLLKSWMYQQAVFYLQQALEKAVKAAALELELITPGETRKELDPRSSYKYSSRALTAIYMLKACRDYGFEVDFERILQSLEFCANVLRMFFDKLEQYAEGLAPETISILEDALGSADIQRMLKLLARALRGAEELVNVLESRAFGWEPLDDSNVAELEEALEKLSKALIPRAENLASEVFSF